LSMLLPIASVRFYNALVSLPEDCVYKGVLKQNMEDAFAAHGATSRVALNFTSALHRALKVLLPSERGLLSRMRALELFDPGEIDAALAVRYREHITQLSRVHRGEGSKIRGVL